MFQNVYFWACEAWWRWRLIVAVSRVKGLVDSKVTVPTVSQARHEVLQNLTTLRPPSNHQANMTSRAARCFCQDRTGMPVFDSSSLNGPSEGLHASPRHYQRHYRRQGSIANLPGRGGSLQQASKQGTARGSSPRRPRCISRQVDAMPKLPSQLPVATIQIMAWTARVGDLPTAKPPLFSSLCLSRLRSLRRLVPGVACTIPRLRSSLAMEADVPLVSRKEGNAPLPAAVG